MTDISVLQAEIARWEKDLAALEEERTAEGWTEPEKLLFTAQRTIATYHRQELPRITPEYSAIIADEINHLVDRLDELRNELIRSGQTAQLQLQTAETLAGLRALGRVVLRFAQEVEIPRLAARLTPEQSDQQPAVHSYEKDLRT